MSKFIKCAHNLVDRVENFIKYVEKLSKVYALRLISSGTFITAILFVLLNIVFVRFSDECKQKITEIATPQMLIIFISAIISLFISYIIDKWMRNRKFKKRHYPYLYRMIKEVFLEILSDKSVLPEYEEQNAKIDEIAKSPLQYAAETLKGNSFPSFNPDYEAFNEIYENEVKLIVAITAENPNLWLDPTQYFYLINCFIVSLKKEYEKTAKKTMTMKGFEDENGYENFIKNRDDLLLEKLIEKEWNWSTHFKDFHFCRFFLYDKKEKDFLQKAVFPSLKASHDLFNIKSFFIDKDTIKENLENGKENLLGDYEEHVRLVWEKISQQERNKTKSFNNVIKTRKKDCTPEFLILFKEDDNSKRYVKIHTFVNGKPYFIRFDEDDTNETRGYKIIQTIISDLAKSVDKTNRYIPEPLNTKNSYIEWG